MTQQNSPQDDFFIGYSRKIPLSIKKFLLKFIPLLVLSTLAFAVVLPLVHSHFNTGRVSGNQEFEGLLLTEPIPHIMVPRPGNTDSDSGYSRYILAGLRKVSASPEILELAGKWVKLSGLPIHRNDTTLIASRSAEEISPPSPDALKPESGVSLGEFSLQGEIIDTKCYLGTMKPGQTKTHRGCAIRCISGGVPPGLITHNDQGDEVYFALVDRDGKAVNEKILELVADPITVTGEVVKYGDLLILKADPDSYEVL